MVLIEPGDLVNVEAGIPEDRMLMDAGHGTGRSKAKLLLGSALGAATSIVLIVGGTMLLGHGAPMWVRVIVVCAGLALAYRSGRTFLCAIVGRPVDTALAVSVGWVGLLVVASVLAPILPLGESSNSGATLSVQPLLRPDLFSAHPLGTNSLGLDMLSRVVWGARDSLTTALVAIVLSTIVGGMIGLVAGYRGGWVDRSTRVGTNIGLAFPPLVLLLVLGAIVGHSSLGVSFALAILSVPSLVRLARGQSVRFAAREHAYVAHVLGGTQWQVLRREVLPPVAMSLVSFGFLTVPFLIVAEATLGYLGMGVLAPTPTWGNMIAEAANGNFEENPHLLIVPGAVLVFTVFALNLIGQRISAKWDAG